MQRIFAQMHSTYIVYTLLWQTFFSAVYIDLLREVSPVVAYRQSLFPNNYKVAKCQQTFFPETIKATEIDTYNIHTCAFSSYTEMCSYTLSNKFPEYWPENNIYNDKGKWCKRIKVKAKTNNLKSYLHTLSASGANQRKEREWVAKIVRTWVIHKIHTFRLKTFIIMLILISKLHVHMMTYCCSKKRKVLQTQKTVQHSVVVNVHLDMECNDHYNTL